MKKIILSVILIFALSSSVVGNSISTGVITNTCEDSLEFIDTVGPATENDVVSAKKLITAGIVGYLSGMNQMFFYSNKMAMNVNHDDQDYIYAYVMNYCKKNPDESLEMAVLEYFSTLPKYKD
tara:strand:- start:375 stop:743 length:369 start_codon:yes stop_codon:yes gene_type:complete